MYFFNENLGKLERNIICGARSVDEVYERTEAIALASKWK
jgi:hypothetical protein